MLLAQGDFAAFLKATGDERAELLEKMTGTEHYSLLSKAAHERAGVEKAALARLEDRLGLVRLLGDQELQELQATLAAGRAELEAVNAALRQAEAEVEWHRRLAELDQAQSQAAKEAEEAALACSQAQPQRQELADFVAVEPLQPALQEVDLALREDMLASGKLRQAEQALAARADVSQKAGAALAEQERAAALGEEERLRLEPELQQARQLDVRLVDAGQRLEQARTQAQVARDAQDTARQKAVALEKEESEARARRDGAEKWLADKANLGELVRQWDRWEREVQRFREADEAWKSEESGRPGLAEVAEKADGALAEAEKARARALEALRDAREALQHATAAHGALVPDELTRQREALDRRLALLRDLARIGQDALRCRQAETQARAEAAARQAEAEKAGLEAARSGDLTALEARLEEARRALDGLRASLDLEGRRACLLQGEPCPLCGATEHPYCREGAPPASALQAQEKRVAELERQVLELRQALTQARTRVEMHRSAAADHERQAEKASLEAAAHEEAWVQAGASEPDLPVLAPGCLDPRLVDLEEQREAVRKGEQEASRLAEAVQKARELVEHCQKKADEAADAVSGADRQARQAREATEASGRRQEEARHRREAAVNDLSQAFVEVPGWEESLRRHPQAFAERCALRVAEWNGKLKERDEAQQLLTRLTSDLSAARALVEAGTRGLAEKEEACRVVAEEHGLLLAERTLVLGGRPTVQVEGELRRKLEAAGKALEEARQRDSEARALTAQAEGHHQACLDESSRRQVLLQATREALERALSGVGLPEAEVRRRLERGVAWAQAVRAQLEDLEARRRESVTVLQERTRARQQHEAPGRPQRTAEEAQEACRVALQSQSAAQLQVARVQSSLELDAANRQDRAAVFLQVEAQRERWRLWESLRDLIGSADGKRFRVFAQGLTLDALLAEANANLADLAPRYRLDRVPSSAEPSNRSADLEIQVVDLDMGDTVRSVQSLSGGESFLVSLALALGLSTMAAERARIDSLFIDEGFGSLDAETLETALSCLEALQAGGRQVGIISHVSGLAERIGARVRVEPQGSGRSRVLVEGLGT